MAINELAAKYDPHAVEGRWYEYWMEHDLFHSEPDDREPYVIVIPPPNVTGVLHMGHMLNNTIQDILVRRARMTGKNALWVPGTDHAAISTEAKVVAKLAADGIDKSQLTREEFLKHAWDWTHKYGGIILQQLKRLGASCDWSRTAFTMDPVLSASVIKVFNKLYTKGYIYRGARMVNWDPKALTALSDEEVIYKEEKSHLFNLRYYVADDAEGRYIVVATTRPETILGDTAVCINPNDERYHWLRGKRVIVPLVGREVPIIEDEYVEMDFGTGCLKVTPAHDVNDYNLGLKHNLPSIDIFNPDGTISEAGGMYVGKDRFEVRKLIMDDLKARNLVEKVEDYVNKVGHSERTDAVIEPKLSTQWFVRMDELAKPALKGVEEDEIKFVPAKFKNLYRHWMTNIKDWCISRQLWWGHRIPAWYCDDCGEMVVSIEKPGKCPKCGKEHWTQDPDTLDTWFSSALWPFSTLGWPEKTEDLDYFYPNDVLVTGYDIIFFWVIRMIFSGYEQMGKAPFHTVLFHGLVRDSQGRKMSKSLGNGIDPLEVIDKYGADALRLTLITGNAPGNDMRFYWERVEASRNFANKVWNASRFIMMNLEGVELREPKLDELHAADKWILSRVNTLAKDATENMDKFELGIAVQKVYDFIWDEFCDWYIEIAKVRTYKKDENPESANAALWTLKTVLVNALKLLHPYMPFITEEIFCTLQSDEETIMLSKWPEYKEEWNFPAEEAAIEHCKDLVKGIRNVRTQMDVPPSRKAKLFITSDDEAVRKVFEDNKEVYVNLAFTSEIAVQQGKAGIGDDAVSVVIPDAVAYLPLEDLVDFEKEKERLNKEKDKLTKELARSRGMLSNEKFLNNAKPEKVQEEKDKLAKYEQMMAQVEERLAQFK